MNDFPYILNEHSVTIYKGSGKPLTAHKTHANFKKIVDCVRKRQWVNIERLFKVKDTLERCFNVTIKNGQKVFYKGKPVENVLTAKILKSLNSDQPYKSWVNFLNKLMENPNEQCRNQLFAYVERYGLPIDENGFIYTWKAVNNELWDKYTGKTHRYKVGSIIKKPRKDCEQNPNVACGPGLHCGEATYVSGYGAGGRDRFVMVRFSPKDVISCPSDCDYQKLRTCKLRVMREVKRSDIIPIRDTYMGQHGRLPSSVEQNEEVDNDNVEIGW